MGDWEEKAQMVPDSRRLKTLLHVSNSLKLTTGRKSCFSYLLESQERRIHSLVRLSGVLGFFLVYLFSIEPEIGAEDSMVTDSLYEGYNVDESPSSPAINNNANSPDEIEAKFGKISYHKAGSVIRMIHHLLGAKAFQLGLKDYLKQNQFKVGYPDKLYTSFHQAAINTSALADYPGTNIAGIMGPWITQPGHPILTVNIDYENESVLLTQKRFYLNSSYDSNETYPIPVTYTTELAPDFNNTKPAFIMNERSRVLNLTGLSTEPWLIFNVQETALDVVTGAVEIAVGWHEKMGSSVFLVTLQPIGGDYWQSPPALWWSARAITLMEGIITKLGYEVRNTDDFDTLRNRMQVLVFACKLGHQGCIDNAIALFKNFRGNGTEISPSLRPVVYCYGLRHGTVEDDDFLIQRRWFTTNLASEALMIRTALNCPDDKKRLQKQVEGENEHAGHLMGSNHRCPWTPVNTRGITDQPKKATSNKRNHLGKGEIDSSFKSFIIISRKMSTTEQWPSPENATMHNNSPLPSTKPSTLTMSSVHLWKACHRFVFQFVVATRGLFSPNGYQFSEGCAPPIATSTCI
ncbi:hypothetical protein MSG28_003041 [Choristoneura fumiferana]|uniref:Uncharacterized protein n=1 Tax=Choristoneura fumiferana TaxID=7141 RepID=A0ACC0JKH9_CHOFU|nr:hypothetical protein MSG28_003041 [Choristoneura fumiferana]